MSEFNLGRRRVMQAVGAGLLMPSLAPAVIASVKDRPQLTDGVQSGDVLGDRAMVWSRSDRAARMVVEWDTRSLFTNPEVNIDGQTGERGVVRSEWGGGV